MSEPMTFKLTEDHIKLLRRMSVYFDDSAYDGAPAVNIKRPYGNSGVASDVCEILGWTRDSNCDCDRCPSCRAWEQRKEAALIIHRQTATALQIVLSTGSMIPGAYVRRDRYDTSSWERAK